MLDRDVNCCDVAESRADPMMNSPGGTRFDGFDALPTISRSLAAAFTAMAGAAFAGDARNVASGARLDRRIEARLLTGYQPSRELYCRDPARDGYQRRIVSHWLRGPLKTHSENTANRLLSPGAFQRYGCRPHVELGSMWFAGRKKKVYKTVPR